MMKVGVEVMSGELGRRLLRWSSIGRSKLMSQAWTIKQSMIISFYSCERFATADKDRRWQQGLIKGVVACRGVLHKSSLWTQSMPNHAPIIIHFSLLSSQTVAVLLVESARISLMIHLNCRLIDECIMCCILIIN